MTSSVRRLAELWYGPLPLSEVARLLGQSETRVRVDAVMVCRLGPRDPDDSCWRRIFPGDAVPDRRKELVR